MINQLAWSWYFLNIVTIIILAFYSMIEMAAVSFNPIRLQYYVSKGVKQAIWLNYLLHRPSRLFGTTLLLVNITTFSGSEFARKSFEAYGINPDLSVIPQVFLVVVFGELAPMFAARRYSEHVIMLGMPLLYLTAKLMIPFLWTLEALTSLVNFIIGKKSLETNYFLNQEELLKILESKEESRNIATETEDYDTVAANIFNLNKKQASEIMNPLEKSFMIPSNATVLQARKQFAKTEANYLIMFHQQVENVLGIIYPRNLIRFQDSKKLREFIDPPWFVTESTKVLDLLNQFRTNNKNIAIVLDHKGLGSGIIHLDDLMEEIFGKTRHSPEETKNKEKDTLILDRTFQASMNLYEFKKLYDISLAENLDLSFAELIKEHLGSHPQSGELIYLEPFEIIVEETSLTDIKTVTVRTIR